MVMALSVDKKAYHSWGFHIQFEASLLGKLFYFRDFLGAGGDTARMVDSS